MRTTTPCLVLLCSLIAGATAVAQEDAPHLGYAFPAGGQQGTQFRVLLGGQHLDGATRAYVSGAGVLARAVAYTRPLNQGQFKEMQNRIGALMRQKEAGDWDQDDERDLADLRERLSDFAVRRSSVPALVETVVLEVEVAEDAAPGRRELRLQTGLGLTNPVAFVIGQLPEFTETSGRATAEQESRRRGGRGRKQQAETTPDPGTTPPDTGPPATVEVTLPAVMNGQILPGDVDRYRFHARRGQELVVDVSARRLIPYLADAVPGWFQATVSLQEADGVEVAWADDFLFHPDPVLHCEIPHDGEYVVEIRDALFRGREDFVYRMALGELPFITGIFPLGAQAGREARVEVRGWNLPCTSLLLGQSTPGLLPISVLSNGIVSNEVPFAVDSLPDCLEREPNDSQAEAHNVPVPSVVNGRIGSPGDIDVFRLDCPPGARITAEVRARRLNSPLDSILRLTAADGEPIAFNDDWHDDAEGLVTHHADSRLSAVAPVGGTCYLHLWDAQGQGGDECAYRLRITMQAPDFALRVVPSSVNVRAGTAVPLTVHALRRDGFDGEIGLRLVEPPPGFVLTGARIPAAEGCVRCILTATSGPLSEPVKLSLEGFAEIHGAAVARMAVPADDMMQAFVYRHLVPAQELMVAVTGPQRHFAAEVLQTGEVVLPVGGTARVPVSVPPSCFFGAVELQLDAPPPGIALQGTTLDPERGEIVLATDATAVRPGMRGNLIVHAYGVRTGEDTGHDKEQRKKRRILLTALPAIPFAVAERQP